LPETSELVEEVLKIVKKAGFKADLILYPRENRSVDVVARLGDKALIIKVVMMLVN